MSSPSRPQLLTATALLMALAVLLVGCSTPSPNGQPEQAPPIQAADEDVQQEFDRAFQYLDRHNWEMTLDELRLLQSEHAGEEVADVAELYIARALLADMGNRFESMHQDEQQDHGVDDEVFRLLEPLAESQSVDDRIRCAAMAYLSVAYALAGQPDEAVAVLRDYPSASMSPKVLEDDRRWVWPLLGEGLLDAGRYAESVVARGEEHRLLAEEEKLDDIVEAVDEGSDPVARQLQLGLNRAFAVSDELSDDSIRDFLSSDLALVRAVGGWTMIRRGLDGAEPPLDDSTLEALQAVLNDIAPDLVNVGAADRVSELSVALAAMMEPERLVIGAAIPLTGPNRAVGHRALAGMLVAQLAFHAAGEPSVTLAIEDTAGDPVGAYERLVDAGAAAVIGPLSADDARQLIDPSSELGVPVLSLAADRLIPLEQLEAIEASDPPEDGDEMTPPVFRNFVDAIGEARAAARMSFEQFGDRRAAVVYPDMGYGQALQRAFAEEFRTLGGEVVLEIEYERDVSDYVDLASAVAAAEPEAIFMPDTGSKVAEISAFFAQEQIWGVKPDNPRPDDGRTHVHYLGTSLWHAPIVIDQADNYLRGALVPAWYSEHFEDAQTRQFVQSFEAIYESTPDPFVAFAYDSVNTVRTLMLDRGAAQPDEIAASLRGEDWQLGATGRHRFGTDGEPHRELRFLTVDDGAWTPFEETLFTPLDGRTDIEETLQEEDLDTIEDDPVDDEAADVHDAR